MFADDICGRKLDNSRANLKPASTPHPARFENATPSQGEHFVE
jgi:hypothetical protein